MQIGMIGLGRMGGNMARRLSKGGHQCIVFDRNRETIDALAKEGPLPAYSLKELIEKLSAPRAVWVMLPSGGPTEETVTAVSKLMEPGDAIIDGGNSYYVDDIRRAKELASKGIHYVDVGTHRVHHAARAQFRRRPTIHGKRSGSCETQATSASATSQ
jgi:6-phosphogluconate dehydrogenase